MFIVEHKQQHQSIFDVCERGSDGRAIVVRTLYVHYARTINSKGETRYIIYDEDMCPISSIYSYLNWKCKNSDPQTITRMVTPLRLLVAFCTAHTFKDFIIPEEYCTDFVDFLYRNDKTLASTAGLYFSTIKAFLLFIKHGDDPIMNHTHRMGWLTGADGVDRPHSYDDFKYAPKRNPERDLLCPEHNTVKDYMLMQTTMSKKIFRDGIIGDIAGCIILILLFKVGRRIGEVLGLTIEDISTVVNRETGEVSHCLYLRNRVHDKVGQRSKKRLMPKNKEFYANKDYVKAYHSPRNCIKLEEDVYELIKTYIEVQHQIAAKETPTKYATAVADIVNPTQFAADWGFEENHYLFLNCLGGPLTKWAWYKRIRQYYTEAGVPLGPGKSPNHSWRHGIAVILRHELHWTTRQIADFLGHKREQSAEVYAKADYEMMGRLSQVVQQYINHEIESLDAIAKENG